MILNFFIPDLISIHEPRLPCFLLFHTILNILIPPIFFLFHIQNQPIHILFVISFKYLHLCTHSGHFILIFIETVIKLVHIQTFHLRTIIVCWILLRFDRLNKVIRSIVSIKLYILSYRSLG